MHLASERLELSCKISKADALVRWFRDGLEVLEGPDLILEVDGSQRRLLIPTTTVDDTGEYVCDTEDDSVTFLVTVTGTDDDNSDSMAFSYSICNDLIPSFKSRATSEAYSLTKHARKTGELCR